MIRVGKVYGNLMVDVEATNAKLVQRQVNIVVQATQCTFDVAKDTLLRSNNHCKTAIVMILLKVDAETALQKLALKNGFIRQVLT